ncbi:MAG: D-hexose-6-phosphate mutarotase [Verrucomicrobiota bacterium]
MEKSSVIFSKGNGGLPKINVHTDWSEAEIYLNGAHVTKFQIKGEAPLLFMSEKSRFEKGHPIRGGVPVIFPWFGAREGKQMHGFARNLTWELKEISHGSNAVILKLALPDTPEAAEFPIFRAEYWVTVGETLALELKITNQSNENLSFENCLHTYFAVGEIGAVSVVGLKGTEYLDKVGTVARKKETDEQIKFSGETDRVYLSTTNTTEIHDAKLKRKIIVEKEGSASTVVWNPWIAKAKAMADFGDEEYLRMVCVESGNVSENKIVLPPGKTSSLKINLRRQPMQGE